MDWMTKIFNIIWDFIVLFVNENVPLIVGSVKAVIIAVGIMSVVPALVWLEPVSYTHLTLPTKA